MKKVLISILSLFLIPMIFSGNQVVAEDHSAVKQIQTQETPNFAKKDYLEKIVPQVELKEGLMEDLSSLTVAAYINQLLERNPIEKRSSEKSVTTEDFLFRFEGADGNSTATLVSYTGQNHAVVIPREVVREGWESPSEVVAISISAFQSRGITSVEIPDTVKEIGSGAFAYNDLQHIHIPDSVVTLGSIAFANNELSTVHISTSIKELYEGTFIGNQLKAVEIPNSIRKIGHMAFASNELEQISLPASMLTVEDLAFSWNPLKNIYAESESEATRLTEILNPLSMANVTKLTILGTATIELFELDNLTTLNWISIDQGEFIFSFTGTDGNSEATVTGYTGSAKDIVIPGTVMNKEAGWSEASPVTTVGEWAFRSKSLVGVTLPATIKVISHGAFKSNKLSEIVIPDSVVTIGPLAFDTNSLRKVQLSNSLTRIEREAFRFNKLKSVEVPDKVEYIEVAAFSNNELESISLSKSIIEVSFLAFGHNPLKNIYVKSDSEAARLRNLLTPDVMSSVTELTKLGTTSTDLFQLDDLNSRLWNTIK